MRTATAAATASVENFLVHIAATSCHQSFFKSLFTVVGYACVPTCLNITAQTNFWKFGTQNT